MSLLVARNTGIDSPCQGCETVRPCMDEGSEHPTGPEEL